MWQKRMRDIEQNQTHSTVSICILKMYSQLRYVQDVHMHSPYQRLLSVPLKPFIDCFVHQLKNKWAMYWSNSYDIYRSSFILSQCFVEPDQWRQVIPDQILSALFFFHRKFYFLGLVLVGGFGPGTTTEVKYLSFVFPLFFSLTWIAPYYKIKVCTRFGRPMAAASCHLCHWRWTTTQR